MGRGGGDKDMRVMYMVTEDRGRMDEVKTMGRSSYAFDCQNKDVQLNTRHILKYPQNTQPSPPRKQAGSRTNHTPQTQMKSRKNISVEYEDGPARNR